MVESTKNTKTYTLPKDINVENYVNSNPKATG